MHPIPDIAEHPSGPGAGMLMPRMAVVLRIEWAMLLLRYLLYLFVILFHVSGAEALFLPNLTVAAGLGLLHNAWAHWVFYSRRHDLFVSPVNLLLYLARAALMVALTGGEQSELAPLFLLILIGCHVYAPDSPNIPWASVTVCAAYAFTILGGWVWRGVNPMSLPVYANLAALALCGWLMAQLGSLLRRMEADAARRAGDLLSSEATVRAILDNTAEPIVVYGENEFVAEANNPACAFLGLPRERLTGRRFREFLFDDGTLTERITALRERGSLHDEMLMVLPEGGERNVDMHIHSFVRDQRQFFVAMFRDITGQKEFEEAQRQAKRRLEQVNLELQRVNALRAEFYTTVARRLRSPLTALLGFLEMLLDEEMGDVNEDQRTALQSSRRGARRVLDLVDEAFEEEAGTGAEKTARGESGAGKK